MPFKDPEVRREYIKNYSSRRIAAGRCIQCNAKATHSRCLGCYRKKQLRESVDKPQDLSTYAPITYGDTEGKRWFRVTLPIASWSKAIRVQVNPRGQGRFLSKAAKDYRNFIVQCAIVTPPPEAPGFALNTKLTSSEPIPATTWMRTPVASATT